VDKGGSSVVDVRTFLRKKNGVVEIYGVSARTIGEGVKSVRTRGSIFRDFVRTSLMDGPLCSLVHQSTKLT